MVTPKGMTMTASGHQFDKELARVRIKVSPSLQALIANQLDLMEIIEKNHPDEHIFIEQHKSELYQVEDEISQAFSSNILKKETAREKRLLKKERPEDKQVMGFEEDSNDLQNISTKQHVLEGTAFHLDVTGQSEYNVPFDTFDSLDKLANRLSPGLPSAKYEPRTKPVQQQVEIDVRRVAIGASIKALSDFLGRPLAEKEIANIERQVDSYLI